MATKQRLKRLGKKFGREEKIIDAHCINPRTGETNWRFLVTHHKDGRITSRDLVKEGEAASDSKQPGGAG
jgi:hypothetical protein